MPIDRMENQLDVREIAILVSRLDTETAERLLGELPDEHQEIVQRAIAELEHVTPNEEHDVVEQFMRARGQQLEQAPSNDPASDLSTPTSLISTQEAVDSCPRIPDSEAPSDGLEDVLRNAPHQALQRLLRDEYPQTVALVVARMSPEQAALFLAGLTNRQRTDIVRRIAELETMDRDVAADVYAELNNLLDHAMTQHDGTVVGRDALKAILFAADQTQRGKLLSSISVGDPQLAVRLGISPVDERTDSTASPGKPIDRPLTFDEQMNADLELFARALQVADVEVAVLALVGTNPDTVERVLSRLSPSEAVELRRRVSIIGPVRLRDIEYAQQRLIKVAERVRRGVAAPGSSRTSGLILSG